MNWLRSVKRVQLSPGELVKENLRNVYESGPLEVERKRMHTDWLEDYLAVDGPLAGKGNKYKRLVAAAVRSFYTRNDSPLFGDFKVPEDNYEERRSRPISVEEAIKLINLLPFRAKVVAVCQLQSGIRITELLRLKYKEIEEGLEKGRLPLKVPLRNDNGREYFTYLGEDSVNLLKLYLQHRGSLTGRKIKQDEYIFIPEQKETRKTEPLKRDFIQRQILRTVLRSGLSERNSHKDLTWRQNYHTHAFRHIFRTECAHAGIPNEIAEFWMGHDRGVEYIYNHRDKFHEEDFETEYRKVEPYLSITKPAAAQPEQQERVKLLEERLARMESAFASISGDLKQAIEKT